jgi:hypothetical protein
MRSLGLGQEAALAADPYGRRLDMRLVHGWTTIAGALLALAFAACGSSDPTTAPSQTSQGGSAPQVDAGAGDFKDSGSGGQPDPCTNNSPGCDEGEWPTTETEVASTPAPAQDEPLSPDTDAEITARAAQVAIETYRIDHPSYAGADVPALISIESSLADGAPRSFKVISASQDGYALSVASRSGTTFRIERSASGAVRRHCSAPQTGDCPAHGAW